MIETILTPIMTSNTEPSGEVSASSYYDTRYPWHAFTQNENGDIYYNWASNGTSGGEWIQYQFAKAQKVTKIDFYNRNASDGYYPTQLTVKGSNDGINWTELGVYTSFNSGAKVKTTLVIAHPSNYKIYRLIFDSMTPSANGYAGASRIDLIGDSGNIMPLVPVMTSNTTPEGECGASSVYSALLDAWCAFNGYAFNLSQNYTFWAPANTTANEFVYYKFPSGKKKVVKKFKFATANEVGDVDRSISLIASNDGISWNVIDTKTIVQHHWQTSNLSYEIDVSNDSAYSYYGIRFNDAIAGIAVGNAQFYSEEKNALIPTMQSNTTPSGNVIYDHYNGHNFPTGGGYGYGDKQYYAFDKANNTCCCINQEGIANAWIGYEFSEPVKANKLVARLGNFSATDSFVVKAQYHNGTDWVDAADPVTVSGLSDGNSQEFIFNFTKTYTSAKFRLITPTTKTSGTNLLVVEFQIYAPESDTHLKSSGSTEAIRDWLNASLYNKEEIDDLFIRNNQSGLIPYDLMITGNQPEQMIKLVGQTSGKTYNICLAAILGDDMKETVLWTNSGSTNPQTITLSDDWSKYKLLMIVAKASSSNKTYITSTILSTNILKDSLDKNENPAIVVADDTAIVYYIASSVNSFTYGSSKDYYIYSILGYS